MAAADRGDRLRKSGFGNAVLLEEGLEVDRTLLDQGEEDVFHAGEFVLHFLLHLFGRIHDRAEILAQVDLLAGIALHRRFLVEELIHPRLETGRVDPDFFQHRTGHAIGFAQQRGEQMHAPEFGVVPRRGERLGGLESLLELVGELVRIHGGSSLELE